MRRNTLVTVAVLSATTAAMTSACFKTDVDCTERGNCDAKSAAGATSGGSGGTSSLNGGTSTGTAGTTGIGGNDTAGAAGATTAGTAGTTALPCDGTCTGVTPICKEDTNLCVGCLKDTQCTGLTPACNSTSNACVPCTTNLHCPALTPVCNTTSNLCVECTSSGHCPNSKPVCDPSNGSCAQCLVSSDCKDSTKPVCQPTSKSCVACLSNTDCKTAAASLCDQTTNTCAPCQVDADCSQITGKNLCLTGSCVQCTGKKYDACGLAAGKALVCDSLAHSCSATNTIQSSGLCQPCVSDAQCALGQLCYQEMFNSTAVGYFCFWKQGDTLNGAPAVCFATANRPYVKAETNAVSIDNETATLCTLRVSTCTALAQYSSKDCAPTGTPNDQLCGFAPTDDSKCAVTSSSGVYRCTTRCGSDDDCVAGFACNTGVSPRVCNL